MSVKKFSRKRRDGIRELLKFLKADNFNIEEADPDSSGKSKRADLILNFKGRKYPITVKRKASIPSATLEREKDDGDMLIFRKNRKNWKVYMDLNLLILLLLNNRS